MKRLAGRWALVTGSSRGIGRQIALGLAGEGCRIVLHGRHRQHCEQTLELVRAMGVETAVVEGALDSENGVQTLLAGLGETEIEPDILYNNAAINNSPTPMFEFGADAWTHTFQVNVFAPIQIAAALAPGMRERGWGRIVNLTSGIADQPDLAPYSASKAALDKYTRDLAFELKDDNVLVNAVDPGWIRTDMGGPQAWEAVDSVLPGVLVPALLPDGGPTGRFYAAQDYKGLWD